MQLFTLFTAFMLLLAARISYGQEPEIDIDGVTDAQESNIRAFLSLAQDHCQAPAWRIEKQFANADGEIRNALSALGYYHPQIDKKLRFEDECWQAEFTVQAGEPVIITQLSVQIRGDARHDPAFQKLLATLPLKKGDILNHGLYAKIKQDLQSLALEHGYLDNKLSKKELRVNPASRTAVIELVFDSGPRHTFGDISIDQDVLNPDFIQRFVTLKKGDYYSSKKLAQTYNAFADSIYFSNVQIQPQFDHVENNQVPVDIKLTPNDIHDFSFGIGFDTDIGPLGSFGYQNRRLNRDGHYFSFNLDASPILSGVEARYTIPFAEPRTDFLSFGLGYQYEKPNTFKSELAKFSALYQHVYENGWKQALFLDLSRETFTIDNVSTTTTLLVPGIRWQYSVSNDLLRPTQGHQLEFSVVSAPETLISDVRFVQATASGKQISELPWPARLITRAKVGATVTNDFNRLPASYRFYAGGTETIRGYAYKELGPTDDSGDVIGGKMLTVASVEYEHFITDEWGAAVFFDAGNAYNPNDITIKRGAGVGVRWVSPIGPLRLDFAVPLDESKSSFQFHFAAGAQL